MFARKKLWSAGAVLALAAVAIVAWQQGTNSRIASRTYRMGWQADPPFQSQDPGGKPTGLAIDLVREAARRRGIRLEWIQRPEGVEAALLSKTVDLWPFVTVSPARDKLFHTTDPYLETELCLLVPAARSIHRVEDLAHATIGLGSLPINMRWVQGALPEAHVVQLPDNREVINQVCLGRTDAAFLEEFSAVDTLLLGGACAGTPLRWIPVPNKRSRLGVGATFESSAAADAIRDEIGVMAAQGKLDAMLGNRGFLSGIHLENVETLLNARRRELRLQLGIAMFAVLFVLSLWQMLRIRKERNRTRMAERAHRETEQKLRLMANNLTEMVLAYDMTRKLIFANPAVESLSGYSVADLRENGLTTWAHPDDRPRAAELWDRLFQGQSFGEVEYRLIARNGATKWVLATWGPILDEAGRQVGVQGCERDITERKLAEVSLRESERRFRGLLENVQMAAIIVDREGCLTFCNDYFLKITGWMRDEVIGHALTEILTPEDGVRVGGIIQSFSEQTPQHWTATPGILTKKGEVRWFQSNALLLYDTDGLIVGAANLAVDITDHRVLQEQYLQAQKMEGLGRLAGGVAHDFNNLLTVINGYSDIIYRKLEPGDPLRVKVDQIGKAGARAADLTQQLLAFSRKQLTQPRPLDLNTLLRDSLGMWHRLLGENVELVMHLEPALGHVMADAGQMHQVVMNLVVNARDAMPEGGKLSIATRNVHVDPAGRSLHPEAPSGPCVLMAVSDNGAGMDSATMKHIFDPFFTTKPAGEGTGLGLATVYGIVRQSHGWIEVESEPGAGTVFNVYLPRIASELPVPEEEPDLPRDRRCRETILLVEDQEDVRQFAADVLEECGYRVLSTSNGPDALALVQGHPQPIELLVTDVILPGMNGPELADRLTTLHVGMRVLFTSGYTGDVSQLRTVLDRGLAYLQKPYSPPDIAAKVREILDQ
jgi:two-component system, cell cycle sensor histidine kinase and response regulator CckA